MYSRYRFPTSDEDSSTPDVTIVARGGCSFEFPTSDEDSSTPDRDKFYGNITSRVSFRPLTRIHLLLTQDMSVA